MQLALNPKNAGKIKNPDAIGIAGNLACGDLMKIYLKVDKKTQKIKDIKFETFGCMAAIATSTITTQLAKNKTLQQAAKITSKDILKALGKLPPIKVHCSLLATDALHEAIYNYLKKHNLKIPKTLETKHKQIEKTKKKIKQKH